MDEADPTFNAIFYGLQDGLRQSKSAASMMHKKDEDIIRFKCEFPTETRCFQIPKPARLNELRMKIESHCHSEYTIFYNRLNEQMPVELKSQDDLDMLLKLLENSGSPSKLKLIISIPSVPATPVHLRKLFANNVQVLHRANIRHQSRKHSGHRITPTLIALIIMHLLLVSPSGLLTFFKDYVLSASSQSYHGYIVSTSATNVLLLLNFSTSFVLYCVISLQFRKTAADLLTCRYLRGLMVPRPSRGAGGPSCLKLRGRKDYPGPTERMQLESWQALQSKKNKGQQRSDWNGSFDAGSRRRNNNSPWPNTNMTVCESEL